VLKRRTTALRSVGAGYCIVLLFLVSFIVLLTKGIALHPSLGEPRWAGLIALIVVLPLLLPPFMKYLGPRLTGLTILNIVELSFTEVQATHLSLHGLGESLKEVSKEEISAAHYAEAMTSYSNEIIETVKTLQQKEYEAVVIDLGDGKSWIPPNLYFLALLITYRTQIKQIIFVETEAREGLFVGMCPPGELVRGLGDVYPDYREAAEKAADPLLRRELGQELGTSYFGALRELFAQKGVEEEERHKLYLSSSVLLPLVGKYLQWQQIEWKDNLTEQDYQHILCSSYPYFAAIKKRKYELLISRDRVALRVARTLVEKSVA